MPPRRDSPCTIERERERESFLGTARGTWDPCQVEDVGAQLKLRKDVKRKDWEMEFKLLAPWLIVPTFFPKLDPYMLLPLLSARKTFKK